jgi:hypothetical protein
MFPCHRPHSRTLGGGHFLVKNLLKMVVHAILTKLGVVWPLIIDQRLVHLSPHMFPSHRSQSWISSGDHFLVKNSYVLASGNFENGRLCYFRQNRGLLPLINDRRLIHLTPHMFPCLKSYSWISGGDHLLAKNP